MSTKGARRYRPVSYPSGRRGDAVDLRGKAPRWMRDWGRDGLLEWGRLTASRRSTATLVIIGAQRAGSTSLYRYLVRQPAVLRGLTKEVRYFDLHYERGTDWYRGHFPTLRRLDTIERRTGVRPAVCEASPDYLYHRDVPERLAGLIPDARLVALLRDPVERAYSHYQHETALGFETLPFEAAIDAEPERLRGGGVFAHQHHSYSARGRYLEQLERWERAFDRSQLLVVRAEDLFADPERIVNEVLVHAGLPADARGPFPRQNSLRYGAIAPDVRAALERRFAPDNEALAARLGPAFRW